jgi:hypothetical protein
MLEKCRNKKRQKPTLQKLNWNAKKWSFKSSRPSKLSSSERFKNNRPKNVSSSRDRPNV